MVKKKKLNVPTKAGFLRTQVLGRAPYLFSRPFSDFLVQQVKALCIPS